MLNLYLCSRKREINKQTKRMPEYIIDEIEICSDDSDEEILMKEVLMKKSNRYSYNLHNSYFKVNF